MKHKDLHASLIALLLSFLFGFATVGCLLTGYGLRAELLELALWCMTLSTLFVVVIRSRHWAWFSVALLSSLLLIAVFHEDFRQQLLSFVDQVCQIFAKAYDLSAPTFRLYSKYTPHLLPLLAFHSIVSYTCAYALIKRQTIFMAAIPAVLFLTLCFLTLDTMPALPYLLLFLFTFLLILMTHAVRRQDAEQGIRLTRLLALPMAAVLLLTLLVIPTDTGNIPDLSDLNVDDFWEQLFGPGGGYGDPEPGNNGDVMMSDEVSLKDLAPRDPNGTAVMKVVTSFSGTVYLRAQDFDQYTGTAWISSADRSENDLVLPSLWTILNGGISIQPVTAQKNLYIPCYPSTPITINGGKVTDESCPESYSFTCASIQKDWQSQWRKGIRIPSVEVDARYLSLPAQTNKDAQALLQQIGIRYAADTIEKVDMIHRFVQNAAKYDQSTTSMPGEEEDFAIWFLTQAETGFCVHYATAATVLLRAAGIPARYVEGYNFRAISNAPITVRDTQAHAWVEYYLDGAGWILLDPTNGAPDYVQPSTTRPSTQTTTVTTTTPSTQPTTETTQPTTVTTQPTTVTTQPTTVTTQPTTVPSGIGVGDGDGGSRFDIRWLMPFLISFFLACVFLMQYRIRRKLKKRKLHRGDPNTQALTRYKEAMRLSKLSGLPMPESLTALAEKAKFSQHTLTDAELAVFDQFFLDCADAIRKGKLPRRFYLCFIRAAY